MRVAVSLHPHQYLLLFVLVSFDHTARLMGSQLPDGIEPLLLAVKAQSPHHWTAGKFHYLSFLLQPSQWMWSGISLSGCTFGVEHLFMCLFDIINIFFGQVPLHSFCSFEKNTRLFVFSLLCYKSSLCILDRSLYSIRHEFCKYFLSVCDLHICFLMIFFEE